MSPILTGIAQQLIEVQEGGLWLDESFKDKIDQLSDEEALTRPIPQMHSVAELVSHLLVWRKECMQRLNGITTALMDSPDNWRDNAELKKIGWSKLKSDFYDSQAELINHLMSKDDSYLETTRPDIEYNFRYLIEGMIHHDLYHLGQIGITIKLLKANRDRNIIEP